MKDIARVVVRLICSIAVGALVVFVTLIAAVATLNNPPFWVALVAVALGIASAMLTYRATGQTQAPEPSGGSWAATAKRVNQRLRPATIAAIWCGAVVLVVVANQLLVESFTKSFVIERQEELGGRYLVQRVDVPLTAVISSSYEIGVTLRSVDRIDEVKVIRPRIDGFCIINACTISVRRWELFAL